MNEYRFSEKNAKKTVRNQMITSLPIIFVGIGGGFYIANKQYDGIFFNNPLVLSLTIVLSFIAIGIGLITGYKNNTKSLMKNIYRINENGVERKTPSDNTIIIDFNQIKMHKVSKSGILIKGNNQEIHIPSRLDKYDEIFAQITEKLK